MLSPQEALLFQAVKEEQANQQAAEMATGGGAVGGALLGAGIGAVPHGLGNALNNLRSTVTKKPVDRGAMQRLRPGFRMAGGLTGMILGGGLGAGTAALMKESPAARLLGKIQAQGGDIDEADEIALSQMLGDIYSNPSQMM